MKTYKGKYKLQKPRKYAGDVSNVVYRSLWERQVFRWCEGNDNIKKWASESLVIPYFCQTDRKTHKYYTDIQILWKDNSVTIVEIKPKSQCSPPNPKRRKTKRFINEQLTYLKNESKWITAKKYCDDRGWRFEVWHEDVLKQLGIKIVKG